MVVSAKKNYYNYGFFIFSFILILPGFLFVEQGEDMQGYVTELILTLEAVVETLDSDFRPMDIMKVMNIMEVMDIMKVMKVMDIMEIMNIMKVMDIMKVMVRALQGRPGIM